jgi:cob(I)alamin adenosyltransferase
LKIYTGFGDTGQTQLFGGQIVSKDDLRVEAYGTADELNSQLGLLISELTKGIWADFLRHIQQTIFRLSAELATPLNGKSRKSGKAVDDKEIRELEEKIDQMDSGLPALKNFILPGGGRNAALAHLARTVCRRLERRLITLHAITPIDADILVYINRLSDFLFVLARMLNQAAGIEDILWKSGR